MHILVAEDNPVNQFLIKEILQKSGYSLELVENGQEAVKKIAESSFDLVLMDIRMPILDGIKATKIIRETYESSELPIIGLTADDVEKNRFMYHEIGMNNVLPKPLDLEELIGLLKSISPNNAREQRLLNRVNRLFGSDEDLKRTLLRIFIEDSQKRIPIFVQAIEENDLDSLNSTIHSMKPSIGHLGEKSLYRSLIEIECNLSQGKLEEQQIRTFLTELQNLVFQCREILSKIEK